MRVKGAARVLEVCRWADSQPWATDPRRRPRQIVAALKNGYGALPEALAPPAPGPAPIPDRAGQRQHLVQVARKRLDLYGKSFALENPPWCPSRGGPVPRDEWREVLEEAARLTLSPEQENARIAREMLAAAVRGWRTPA